MAGTKEGGHRAAATNKQRYGGEFYHTIGRLGGKKSTGGGFAKDPELARMAGRLGGLRSRRLKERRPCAYQGCDGTIGYYSKLGYCYVHLNQVRRGGVMQPIQRRPRTADQPEPERHIGWLPTLFRHK